MLGTTHILAGAIVGASAMAIVGAEARTWPWGMVLGAVTGLLPDIDTPGSLAGRIVPGRGRVEWPLIVASGLLCVLPHIELALPWAIPRTLWLIPAAGALIAVLTRGILRTVITHRGPTHSLAALAGLGWLLPYLWPNVPHSWWVAMMAGYGSHIVIDLFNPQGVALLWPIRKRWSFDTIWMFPLRLLVVRTGTKGETVGWRSALFLSHLWFWLHTLKG